MSALVCDTSGLIAYFDGSDNHHYPVRVALEAEPGPLIVSPFVLAELDYLLASRGMTREELAALVELATGAWELAQFDAGDLRAAHDIIIRYGDQPVGLTDASVVVLAARYQTSRVLTLDHRHFGVLRTVAGKAFTLLP